MKSRVLVMLLGLMMWSTAALAGTPCACEVITLSGAGAAAVNDTYTYHPAFRWEYAEDAHAWFGRAWTDIPDLTAYWAVVRLGTDGGGPATWAAGVVVFVDGDEYVIFTAADGYYLAQSSTRCPTDVVWSPNYGPAPAPTVTGSGCLCGAFGDMDGDGDTDFLDVRIAYAYVEGAVSLPVGIASRADVDGDGDVDIADAQMLAQWQIGFCP